MNDEWCKEEIHQVLIKEQAYLQNEKYKVLIARMINKKMKARSFLEGALVLRRVNGPHRILEEGKLEAN